MPLYKCQHPVKFLSYITKNFWLLIIPLIRGLYYSRYNFKAWVKGAWLDILILFFILGYAFLKYRSIKYSFDKEYFYFKKGIFFKQLMTVPFNALTCITFTYPFFLRPFKSGYIILDTFSGSKKNPEVEIAVSTSDIDKFKNDGIPFVSKSKMSYSFYPQKIHLVFFSLFFSNTLSGVILISTFIYQSGKIVGNRLESLFFSTFHTVAIKIAKGIPPIAFGLALVIISGWLLAVGINILVNLKFSAKRQTDIIKINKGFFTKRIYYLKSNKINFIDFRQTLLTIMFKISSVYIHCPGYGKDKHSLAVLVPITTKKEIISTLNMLLPDYPTPKVSITPPKNQIQRFIFAPVTVLCCIPLVYLTVLWLIPQWSMLAMFVCIITSIPTIWFIDVKVVSTFCTGVGIDKDYITLKYCRFFKFHTVVVPKDKITMVKIVQTPYDRNIDNCRLVVYTNSEKTKYHTIKYISYSKTAKLLEQNRVNFLK